MSTKNDVLKALEANRGTNISGTELAKTLNISRNAVWKAVKELQRDGYEIDAITNKGYCLSDTCDIVSSEGIKIFLKNKNLNVLVYKSLQSTNQTAKQLAAGSATDAGLASIGITVENAKDGTIVVANQQTAGRGRMGRSFFSPSDTGVYFSIIARPNLISNDAALITTAAAVAVCRTVKEMTGIDCGIKWVNDIILNGKKICGILSEAVTDFESGSIDCVIIGIGINCTTNTFPPELQPKAGCLLRTGRILRNRLIAEVVNAFFEILKCDKNKNFVSEYKKSSVVLGKNIQVTENIGNSNTCRYSARAVDIDQNGGLVIEYNNTVKTLTYGEISIDGDFWY